MRSFIGIFRGHQHFQVAFSKTPLDDSFFPTNTPRVFHVETTWKQPFDLQSKSMG